MKDTLTEICDAKREHIQRRKAGTPLSELEQKAKAAEKPRGFYQALTNHSATGKPALIAEIKKASPSKGLIRADFDPASLAKAYAAGGATCLSVLTDEPYFQGKDDYLKQARAAAPLPVLRKDFMLDTYQVAEARALGADCILLILAALPDALAQELEAAAFAHGMDVLAEVHDEAEMERALKNLKTPLIGINNRNLKTLEVNLATSERLVKSFAIYARGPILGVCESGIATHADVRRMQAIGLSCFLVGESLMRQQDVTLATQQLLGAA